MIVDFHSHTRESDGALAPPELVALMRARGVVIFSITDHDTQRAYGDLGDVGFATLVTGIELNTTWEGNDVHVLGYRLPLDDASPLAGKLRENRDFRRNRAQRIVEGLTAAGYPITLDAVLAETDGGEAIGRPHVARALTRAGLVATVDQAFRQLLTPGKPGYQPSNPMTPLDAVDLILASGGVPVLAHPGRLSDEAVIDVLIERGLVGIEVFYPTHTPSQVAHFRTIAERHGLVMTAGSDFHDHRSQTAGVGVEIDQGDIAPFLERVTA